MKCRLLAYHFGRSQAHIENAEIAQNDEQHLAAEKTGEPGTKEVGLDHCLVNLSSPCCADLFAHCGGGQIFTESYNILLGNVRAALLELKGKKDVSSLAKDAQKIYRLIEANNLSTDGVAVLTDLPYMQPTSTVNLMEQLKVSDIPVRVHSSITVA